LKGNRDQADGRKGGASAFVVGTNLITGLVGLSLLGYYIDYRRGGGKAWTLGGFFVGLVYCGYEVWKLVRGLQAAEEMESPDDNGPS
jgi:F0F1-type ATP synthase assembly protein I